MRFSQLHSPPFCLHAFLNQLRHLRFGIHLQLCLTVIPRKYGSNMLFAQLQRASVTVLYLYGQDPSPPTRQPLTTMRTIFAKRWFIRVLIPYESTLLYEWNCLATTAASAFVLIIYTFVMVTRQPPTCWQSIHIKNCVIPLFPSFIKTPRYICAIF